MRQTKVVKKVMLALTANPCSHPSQYVLIYPPSNLPSPISPSTILCFSGGNCSSTSAALIKSGAVARARYRSKSSGTCRSDGCEMMDTDVMRSSARERTKGAP